MQYCLNSAAANSSDRALDDSTHRSCKSVESLVELCCKAIASLKNDMLATFSKENKTQRLERCQMFLQYSTQFTIPDEAISSVLSNLPINVLLSLEVAYPSLFNFFDTQWQKMCQNCATKSVSLYARLKKGTVQHYMNTPFRNGDAYWSPDEEPGFMSCKGHERNVLLTDYFLGLVYSHNVSHRTATNSNKFRRVESKNILQDTLGINKHDIPDTEMMDVLLKYLSTLNLNVATLPLLQRRIIRSPMLSSLETLEISLPSYASTLKQCDSIFDVTKIVLSQSHVRTVRINIEVSIGICIDLLQKMIFHMSSTKDAKEESELWDVAVSSNTDCELLIPYDFVDIDSELLPDSKISLYHITTFEAVLPSFVGSNDNLYKDCFNHWYSLESLHVAFELSQIRTASFCAEMIRLLESGRSNLKYLKMTTAYFGILDFCKLGVGLNKTSVNGKSVVFQSSLVKRISESTKNTDFSEIFCTKMERFSVEKLVFIPFDTPHYTISVLLGLKQEPHYNMIIIVSALVQFYNPRKLFIEGLDSLGEYQDLCELIFKSHSTQIQLQSMILQFPKNVSQCNELLRVLDTFCSINITIDAIIISCNIILPSSVICNRGNWNVRTIVDNTHDSGGGSELSVSDFVAQM